MSDDSILDDLIEESTEHLSVIEPDFLTLEEEGENVSPDLINRVFRAIHSIKGGFGFVGMTQITNMAHTMENVLMRIRDGELTVNKDITSALIKGMDKLTEMIEDVENSQEADIQDEVNGLLPFVEGGQAPESKVIDVTKSSETQVQVSLSDDCRKAVDAAVEGGDLVFIISVPAGSDLSAIQSSIESLGSLLHPDSLPESIPESGLVLAFSTVMDFDMTKIEFEGHGCTVSEAPEGEAPAEEPPKEEKKAAPKAKTAAKSENRPKKEETIRVKVSLLNKLIDMAGELVLGRNQVMQHLQSRIMDTGVMEALMPKMKEMLDGVQNDLLALDAKSENFEIQMESLKKNQADLLPSLIKTVEQGLSMRIDDLPGLNTVLQNFNHLTSDIQNDIMNTRLQPVGSVFSKFPRVIRDIAKNLNKEIQLELEGEEVELDKTVIEALSDPLTHLIRNSADHGIENPDAREAAGKPRAGTVLLKAYHESGQVNIAIKDDGGGINAEKVKSIAIEKNVISEEEGEKLSEQECHELIFRPGFSTADQVSDISGRGVGMDVVRTNIEKLGGDITIESVEGSGSTFTLRLPLTLAIIPALMINSSNKVFAVPQINLEELVRLRAGEAEKKIENLRGRPVYRLREYLLPLVGLSELLGLEGTYVDDEGREETDRRKNFMDRRAPLANGEKDEVEESDKQERVSGRRQHGDEVLKILVLRVGNDRYGLLVDELYENQEIVVKPVPSYLSKCKYYAGATIQGNGRVAMILDAAGIAETAKLQFSTDLGKIKELEEQEKFHSDIKEAQTMLLFNISTKDKFAINLSQVSRVEKIKTSEITQTGDMYFLNHEDSTLRVIRLDEHMPITRSEASNDVVYVIVPKLVKHPIGLIAHEMENIIQTGVTPEKSTLNAPGIHGTATIENQMIIFLNLYTLYEAAAPDLYKPQDHIVAKFRGKRALLAEDTALFRSVEKDYLESLGFEVGVAENGERAWELMNANTYDVLITDIVMPHMDGVQLTQRIRQKKEWEAFPIIAVTSLKSEKDRKRIMDAGVNFYEGKLDKDSLQETLSEIFKN